VVVESGGEHRRAATTGQTDGSSAGSRRTWVDLTGWQYR
jgi:hypothetical protein